MSTFSTLVSSKDYQETSWVLLPIGEDSLIIDLGAVDDFELFKEDADFATVRSASSVKDKRLGHVAGTK